jgi:hypothetical protein
MKLLVCHHLDQIRCVRAINPTQKIPSSYTSAAIYVQRLDDPLIYAIRIAYRNSFWSLRAKKKEKGQQHSGQWPVCARNAHTLQHGG